MQYFENNYTRAFPFQKDLFSFRKSTVILSQMVLNLVQQKLEVAKLDRYFLP